jgi:hypothetical protein
MKSPHAYRGIEEKAPTKNKNVNKLNIIFLLNRSMLSLHLKRKTI